MLLKRGLELIVGAIVKQRVLFKVVRPLYFDWYNIVYYHGVWSSDDLGAMQRRLFGGIALARLVHDIERLGRLFDLVSLTVGLAGQRSASKHHKLLLAMKFWYRFDLSTSGFGRLLKQ